MAQPVASDFSGQTFGRFRVLELIGRGGMGEVYRARDESLGRDLAIKILPAELTHDPKRVERFVQEARAASALNHPHLLTVYDIGAEPVPYIAMELVHGRTLRGVLESGRPETKQVLDWLAPVADALGAAHDAGVVHRDIKPENLMISGDGYAKVLDFGVAKLRGDDASGEAATRLSLTEAGALLGTSGYMSPEQARGQVTDHRTDVFALGCVLYECITGSAAFQAPSVVERLHRVINQDPVPIAQFAPDTPAELVSIVRKCLAKDPAERYQSMKDLAVDLRHARRLLDALPRPGSGPTVRPHSGHSRRLVTWTALVALTLMAMMVGAWSITRGRSAGGAGRTSASTIQRLTSSGNTIDAVISPDGKYLAHVEAIGARQSMWIRSLEKGDDQLLVPAGDFGYFGLQFSRDGQSVVFTTRGGGFASGRLNIVSRTGGTPMVVSSTIMTAVTFSPDGRQMAFLRSEYPDGDSSALLVANADGTGERVLATRRTPESFVPTFFPAASWSPDGALIVAAVRNLTTRRSQLIGFDPRTGSERVLHASTDNMTFTLWQPDGAGILFVSRSFDTYAGPPAQVWRLPYPSGVAHQITRDLLDYRSLSITADGTTLTAVGAQYQVASISIVPLDGSAPQRVPSERYDGLLGVAPLADGSVIATTIIKGETQLVRIARNGATRTILTSLGSNTHPAASPDGSVVAMVSSRDGSDGVWRMNIDGSDQRLLAHLPVASWLSITPDGQHVICTSYRTGRPSTWRVPIEGGQAVEIGRDLDRASVSPDGKWLGGLYEPAGNAANSRPTAAVIALDGSAPLRTLGTLVAASNNGLLTWSKDGASMIATTNERFNLWSYNIAGGEPRKLTDLAGEDLHPWEPRP